MLMVGLYRFTRRLLKSFLEFPEIKKHIGGTQAIPGGRQIKQTSKNCMGEKGTYHFQIPVISCHFSWLQSWKSKCNQEKLCIGCLQDTLFCCCYVYFIFIEKKKKLCSMVMTCCGEHIGVKSHLNIEEIILYLKKEIHTSKTIKI